MCKNYKAMKSNTFSPPVSLVAVHRYEDFATRQIKPFINDAE